MVTIILICLLIIFCLVPLILTVLNIRHVVRTLIGKPFNHGILQSADVLTMVLGPIYTFLLFHEVAFKEYTKPIVIPGDLVQLHTPVAAAYSPSIIVLFAVGIVGYLVLRMKKLKLPPLMIVILFSFIFIGVLTGLVWFIQLSKHPLDIVVFFLMLFPINFFICSAGLIHNIIKNFTTEAYFGEKHYENKLLKDIHQLLLDSKNWIGVAVILMLPILLILMLILILFGQQPDAAVKAFTETSDWVLSQKISPPPITVKAHYLCTVSLRGHKKIVKPLRYGLRRNEKIVVNRQLLIANAFEQIIEEKVPTLHRYIRYVYDQYGYPLSKHITTPWRADVTYLLMKPLEWLFLMILYLCDVSPETRIAKQYLPKKYI